MRHVTPLDRLRYAFDNTMSRGTPALVAWLGIVSLALVLASGAFVALADLRPAGEEAPLGFAEAAWQSLMRTLDAGTMGGDAGWPFRFAMFGVTLGGVFLVSALIGVIGSGIEARIETLRKGRSFVIETDHTLILGFSQKVFTILPELVIANENRRDAVVVLLADRDKVEMEEEIAAKVPDLKNTRLVVRSGNPCDMDDLAIVNPGDARSIIVLRAEGDDDDHAVVKILLALLNGPFRQGRELRIVTEVCDARSLPTIDLLGRGAVRAIHSDDVIARIMVQTTRQSGLSVLFVDLLDFGGDEIYFQDEPALAGRSFREALFLYEDSSVIGIARAAGEVTLNPPMETRFAPGDRVIAIARDDDKVVLNGRPRPVDESLLAPRADPPPRRPEKHLVIGWNRQAERILEEMNEYAAPGSLVVVAAECDKPRGFPELKARLTNIDPTFVQADLTRREILEGIDPTRFDGVIALAGRAFGDPQAADARTLVILLNLRDIVERRGARVNIVSQMHDEQNRRLAEVTKVDDFVVGDKLVSLLMTQVAENHRVLDVFRDLFDARDAEIYLKPAREFVATGRELDYRTLVTAAARRGETAIGYRSVALAHDPDRAYGIRLNPPKSERLTLAPDDRVIVIGKEE